MGAFFSIATSISVVCIIAFVLLDFLEGLSPLYILILTSRENRVKNFSPSHSALIFNLLKKDDTFFPSREDKYIEGILSGALLIIT